MLEMQKKDLKRISYEIRKQLLTTVYKNRTGHLASSLSCVELMVSLYFGDILNFRAKDPEWEDRDRFILSKGHAALTLYYVLGEAGYFDKELVSSFCLEGTIFGGLAMYGKIPGIETTSGSLGHGLSFASGVAMMGKLCNKSYKVYTLVGEGELNEGENWEAAAFIAHNHLINHTLIIDKNGVQATGYNKDILSMDNLVKKWKAFGFYTIEVNGHDTSEILDALNEKVDKPKTIIAHTVKGKGLTFLENRKDCHYIIPNEEEYKMGLLNLEQEV